MKKRSGSMIVFVVFLVVGCYVDGTRDKSFTVTASNTESPPRLASLAILPIKEHAAFPGLAQRLQVALTEQCRSAFPQAEILDVQTLLQRLQTHSLGQSFGLWRAAYEGGTPLETSALVDFGQAARAHYFLLITSLHLARDRILPQDAGYSGSFRDANNVQRTDLKLTGQLLDTQRQRIVWEGVGHAENIDTGRKKVDLGLIILQPQSRQVPEFIDAMIYVATEGIVTQLTKAVASRGTMTASEETAQPPQRSSPPTSAPLAPPQPAVSPPAERQPMAPSPPAVPPPAEHPAKVVQLLSHYNPAPLLSAPDLDSQRIDTLHPRLKLTVLEEKEAWLYIEAPSGKRGWIKNEWLRKW